MDRCVMLVRGLLGSTDGQFVFVTSRGGCMRGSGVSEVPDGLTLSLGAESNPLERSSRSCAA
jgi:hypothetical protein